MNDRQFSEMLESLVPGGVVPLGPYETVRVLEHGTDVVADRAVHPPPSGFRCIDRPPLPSEETL